MGQCGSNVCCQRIPLVLERPHGKQTCLPALLQLGCDQTVVGVNHIILLARPSRLIARLLECQLMKSKPGPPATLGSSAAAGVRLIVWCKECGYQTEPAPAEQARSNSPRARSDHARLGNHLGKELEQFGGRLNELCDCARARARERGRYPHDFISVSDHRGSIRKVSALIR
jgi:hypothetical protein